MIKLKKMKYIHKANGEITMENKHDFSDRINEKNNIRHKYNELTRLYKKLAKEILNKNGYEAKEDDYFFNELNKIIALYPEEKDVLEEISNMYYGDMLLTENSLNRLIKLYNEMHKIIE